MRSSRRYGYPTSLNSHHLPLFRIEYDYLIDAFPLLSFLVVHVASTEHQNLIFVSQSSMLKSAFQPLLALVFVPVPLHMLAY